MKARAAAAALWLAFACPRPGFSAPGLRIETTSSGVRYGIFGAAIRRPAPTVFIFATSIEDMARLTVYTTAGRALAERGWITVTLDPPCHGKDQAPGEPENLRGWAYRVAKDQDLTGPFVARCRDVLDELVAKGVADPKRVAASGTSRGGFCALHFAAADARVRAVAAVSPVTRLRALREFAQVEPQKTEPFDALALSPRLADRAIWVGIGNDDGRVATDDTIAATRAFVRAAREKRSGAIPMELVVAPSEGHAAIAEAYELAAAFLHHQVVGSVSASKPPGSETLLLADDHHILYRPGTVRRLHPAKRHPEAVLTNDRPWELAIGYCSVQRAPAEIAVKEGTYQLWYQAYSGGRAKDPTRRVVVAYAESDDGVAWRKPELELFAFNDTPKTNIVLVGDGGRSVNYGAAVLVDPRTAHPAERYKMAYWDFADRLPGLFVAFSPDGIHWRKYERGPLLSAAYGEPGQPPARQTGDNEPEVRPAISDVIDLTWDPHRERFAIYAKTWIDGPDGRRFWKRAVVRTESKDFREWTTPELVLAPAEDETGQLHGAPVFVRHGLYLGLLQTLDFGGFDRGGTGNMPGELILSRDGRNWSRPFRDTPFLPVTGDGKSFDAGCLWTNAMPVEVSGELRFYYGAYPGWNADLAKQATGIGLRTSTVDRFVGLRPRDEAAQVTLKPLDLSGVREIRVNANASGGRIRVELLSAGGYRVEGFSKDDAQALEVDALDQLVRWKSKTPRELPAARYQIRLHLEKAEVFALTLRTTID